MDNELEKFFGEARKVALSAAEKQAFLAHLMKEENQLVRNEAEVCHNEHMTPQDDAFFSAVRAVRMQDEDKKASFASIAHFMNTHPVHIREVALESEVGQSPLTALFSLFSSFRLMPVLALAMIFVIGGGMTSVAAHSALPGDTLYPVKVHINESVRHALAVSAQSQAQLDTELAERRLEEAGALIAKGEVKAETQQYIAASIDSQLRKARAGIEELSTDDDIGVAADLSTQLASSLTAHQHAFAQLAAEHSGTMSVILGAFQQADEASAAAHAKVQAKLETRPKDIAKAAAERSIVAAKKQTEHMKQVINASTHLNADAKAALQLRLQQAEESIANAQTQLKIGAAVRALDIAAQANANAREGRVLESVQKYLKVSVKANGGNNGANVQVDIKGDAQPVVDVKGNGQTTVRINGKDVTSAVSGVAASSMQSREAARTSSSPNTDTSVSVTHDETTSDGSTHTSTTVESHTNVNVQGGGSVQIKQNAESNVNVQISN
jgi:hypothetical protein